MPLLKLSSFIFLDGLLLSLLILGGAHLILPHNTMGSDYFALSGGLIYIPGYNFVVKIT